MLVEIVYTRSGRGLSRDADLLGETIRALGHEISVKALPPQHPLLRDLSGKWGRARNRLPSGYTISFINLLQRKLRRLLSITTPSAGLVIHLENIHPRYINPRCPNWLIPNQEWFRTERIPYLTDIEMVLCKTFTAQDCFRPYHPNVRYLGFSTPYAVNRNEWELPEKSPGRILHVAGASLFKGTRMVLDTWKRNPQWPTLTLIANSPHIADQIPANVELKSNLSDEDLRALWREAAIVVIPSEVEGYGQVLAEAMSCGTLVITTDAPPMNQLVSNDRGYLVPYTETSRFRLGMRYKVSSEDLELVLNETLTAPAELRKRKVRNALHWTRSNHDAFVEQLGHYLSSVTPDPQSAGQSAGQSQA